MPHVVRHGRHHEAEDVALGQIVLAKGAAGLEHHEGGVRDVHRVLPPGGEEQL